MKNMQTTSESYEQKKEHSNGVPGDSDISEPARIRYSSRWNHEIDGFLLDYNAYILFTITPILYCIFQIIWK